jgi:hypothetical protein
LLKKVTAMASTSNGSSSRSAKANRIFVVELPWLKHDQTVTLVKIQDVLQQFGGTI